MSPKPHDRLTRRLTEVSDYSRPLRFRPTFKYIWDKQAEDLREKVVYETSAQVIFSNRFVPKIRGQFTDRTDSVSSVMEHVFQILRPRRSKRQGNTTKQNITVLVPPIYPTLLLYTIPFSDIHKITCRGRIQNSLHMYIPHHTNFVQTEKLSEAMVYKARYVAMVVGRMLIIDKTSRYMLISVLYTAINN